MVPAKPKWEKKGERCGKGKKEQGNNLAFTRYCFTSRLLCTNQSSNDRPPAHLHCSHYFNTIASLLRNIRRPPPAPWHEQALVCLSNIEKLSTRAEGVHFIAKWRITVFFTNRFGLIYLAIYPPSIITANVRPPSASMDFIKF